MGHTAFWDKTMTLDISEDVSVQVKTVETVICETRGLCPVLKHLWWASQVSHNIWKDFSSVEFSWSLFFWHIHISLNNNQLKNNQQSLQVQLDKTMSGNVRNSLEQNKTIHTGYYVIDLHDLRHSCLYILYSYHEKKKMNKNKVIFLQYITIISNAFYLI